MYVPTDLFLCSDGKTRAIDNDGRYGKSHHQNAEEVALMQFTGLTDKTGKEIYEGDVCKVVDRGGVWNVAAQEMHSLDSFHFWNHVADNMENGVLYEVIGNIYKNPELLKA
jgi:YopX protein